MTRLLPRQQTQLSAAVRDLAEHLTESGYKVTSPRLGVLDAAVELSGSFTAADIERWLADRQRSPGAASIFRTLKLLTELGMMQRIHGVEECHRYTLSSGHAHRVVCTTCGKLVEFDGCELASLAQQLEQRTGYQIQTHLLEFFGQCPTCRVHD
jgi:Fur family transcriptional regulator, ferric uptake regulator